jgi:predicted nucleotidyltransferase
MEIDWKSPIAGHPAIKVRDALRIMRTGYRYEYALERRLYHGTPEQYAQTMAELQKAGLVAPNPEHPGQWDVTDEGIKLTTARAIPRLSLAKADQEFVAFMDRVRALHRDPGQLKDVARVYLFGSYLERKPDVGDIDIAVEWCDKPKLAATRCSDDDSYEKLLNAFWRRDGRRGSFIEMICWPERKAELALKARRPAVALCDDDTLNARQFSCAIVYEAPNAPPPKVKEVQPKLRLDFEQIARACASDPKKRDR